MIPRWRTVLVDRPARLLDYVLSDGVYLPTRWDHAVPRWLFLPWVIVKTYLVLAGGFAVVMYLLHRAGLPSLWPT